MPVLLTPEHWAVWLGETAASDAQLKAMLKPYPGAGMVFWPVDQRAGNVRNDSPDLFAPLPATNEALAVLLLADDRPIGIDRPAIKYSPRLPAGIIVPSYIGVARLGRALYRLGPAECRVSTVPKNRGRGKTAGDPRPGTIAIRYPRHLVATEYLATCCSSSFRTISGRAPVKGPEAAPGGKIAAFH
jgi:hypothetical protein